MKKLLAVLTTVAMLLSLAIPAIAEGEPVFSVSSVSDAKPGDVVSVDVALNGTYEAHIVSFDVNYDTDLLSIESVDNGALFVDVAMGGGMPVLDYETNPGRITFGAIMSNAPLSTSGIFFTVNFKVADNAPAGDITVDMEVTGFGYMPVGSTNSDPLDYNSVDGIITVTGGETPVDPTPEPPVDPTPAPVEGAVITAAEVTVAPNGEVTVPVTIAGNYEAHTLIGSIGYDSENLTLVDVEAGSMFNAYTGNLPLIDIDTNTDGSVVFGVLMPDKALTGDGELLVLTFKAGENEGTYPIDVEISEFGYLPVGQQVSTPVEVTAVDGCVIVSANAPVEPTPVPPVEPTPVPPVEPTPVPSEQPTPPGPTGTISLIGLGVVAIATGAGVVLFKKKED